MALCLTLPLAAGPITYTMTGTLSGSLNGHAFTNEAFTFVLDGTTAGVTDDSGILVNDATSDSISITGVGSGDFTQPVEALVVPGYGIAGIGNSALNSGVVIENGGFNTWNLSTSLGSLEEAGGAWADGGTLDTSFGVLVITGAENVSFSASITNANIIAAVPEPATIGLVALSLIGMAVRRRLARG
jgi:hypothetical protein